MSVSSRGNYLGADDALDDDHDETCAWCGSINPEVGYDGRMFCHDDCAEAWWYEWGTE